MLSGAPTCVRRGCAGLRCQPVLLGRGGQAADPAGHHRRHDRARLLQERMLEHPQQNALHRQVQLKCGNSLYIFLIYIVVARLFPSKNQQLGNHREIPTVQRELCAQANRRLGRPCKPEGEGTGMPLVMSEPTQREALSILSLSLSSSVHSNRGKAPRAHRQDEAHIEGHLHQHEDQLAPSLLLILDAFIPRIRKPPLFIFYGTNSALDWH